MNFIFFLLPLFCSASLIPDLKNVSKINTTSLISSLTDANPADVIEVRDLIDDLIAAGETDRNTATTARDDAQGVKDAAGTALQDATDLHTETAGDLVSAAEEEARLTLLEDNKRVAKEAAQDAKDDADTALQTAQGHLDSETIRLDGEKDTLERILELLDTLLGETSPTEGEIRLSNYPQGRLQVFKENDWHTVCGHYFWDNHNGGQTACKQLGYPLGGIVHRTAGGPITENEPIYVGTCLAGEIPGQCSGNCCGENCQRNAINCGACAIGTNAAFELQCFGDREGSGGTGGPCTDRDDFAVGDGTGGSERYLGYVDTLQECFDLIMADGDPSANGMTVTPSLTDENPTKGQCFVELGINAHDDSANYRTCAFGFDINAL
jgi:hypothetical protein